MWQTGMEKKFLIVFLPKLYLQAMKSALKILALKRESKASFSVLLNFANIATLSVLN